MKGFVVSALLILGALGLWSAYAIFSVEKHLRDMHEHEVQTQGEAGTVTSVD